MKVEGEFVVSVVILATEQGKNFLHGNACYFDHRDLSITERTIE